MSEPVKEDKVLIEIDKLREAYKLDSDNKNFKALVLGDGGTGKTTLLTTGTYPVHIDSFDPNGTASIIRDIEKGNIVVDNIYEDEDPYHPTMFIKWKNTFESRKQSGYFNHFSTYCLDSSTMWAEAIMNHVMQVIEGKNPQGDAKPGQAPSRNSHYMPQKHIVRSYLKQILSLPCNVIVTGHLREFFVSYTDAQGNTFQRLHNVKYHTTGDGAVSIPLMFSEIYIMLIEGDKYKVLTRPLESKKLNAKSRIGGKYLAQFEEPNIKLIMKKCGWPITDKPNLPSLTNGA